jgi:lipoprotein-anchoring transpeptidase ErfK/SrfK
MTGRLALPAVALALAAPASTVPATAATAAARSCSSVRAPTRATAWRVYVPAATPVRARPTETAGARPALTASGAWRLGLGSKRTRHGDCLIEVRLTRRPNATRGWVAASRVRLARTRWRIEVDRADRRVALLHAGGAVARRRVVVGKPSTPTPAGLFAIAASYRTPRASFEGTWILALTAHSDALHAFEGGDGQVALHGRGGASLADPLGTAASHGCVRLDNRAIGTIVARVGRSRLPGVPVLIR